MSLLLIGFFHSSAQAFIEYTPNQNLNEEIKNQPYRVLPRNERFALAVDADFFKPLFIGKRNEKYYSYDYNHGSGYWFGIRAEYKPDPELTFNIKTIFTQGTSSNGPTYLAIIIPWIGATLERDFLGLHWLGRLSDIGRQTVGTGLFIEQKETIGGSIIAQRDSLKMKVMVDSTGSYRIEGGIVALDFSMWDGLLGHTSMFNEVDPAFNPPAYVGSLYSKKDFESGFGYGSEVGFTTLNWAGLLFLQYKQDFERFHFSLKPQYRHYALHVLGGLAGNVTHTYVSFDQNDKPYTMLQNVFATNDDVNTYSALVNAEYEFNSFYRVFGESEAVSFRYRRSDSFNALFYRAGLKFFLFKNRNDQVGFHIGNKYLIASKGGLTRNYSLPNDLDLENKPLFMKQLYLMVNFSTRF